MTRAEAAEFALKALEAEREAARHCNSLANPEYQRLMRESLRCKQQAEWYVAEGARVCAPADAAEHKGGKR